MRREHLQQEITIINQRLTMLLEQVHQPHLLHAGSLAESLEELNVTLEELQVAQEELCQLNEELLISRQLLEAERQRYQELFEFAPDGYLVTDRHGKILDANRAAADLLNLSKAHLLNKVITVFITEVDRRAFRRELLELQKTEQLSERFVELQPRQNPPFEAAMTVASIRDAAGELLGWRWLIRDVTERRQLEETRVRAQLSELMNQTLEQEILRRQRLEDQLRQQATALQQADRLKDEFLSVVSHELRSPLTAILGWADLLNQQKLDSDMTARALSAIQRNATIQAALIEDLLDISQIVSGNLQLTISLVDLGAVVRGAVETVQPMADAKQIEIQTAIATQASLIPGDTVRLQQILLNLLTNAVKFTPEHGTVWVRLETATTDATPETIITVRDNGQGISPDFLPHLFEQFRQAESSSTRRQGGLGLGLAIVRHLVELHGGILQASSPGLNQGSTFTVRLPLTPLLTSELEEVNPVAAAASLHQVRVLLVENQPDSRELLTVVLEQAGASVTAVDSVAAALTALQQQIPDILVSDLGMPEADGYLLIQAVRAMKAMVHLPAIALTARTSAQDQAQILASGFQVHLAKPIPPAQLIAVIASQLRPNRIQ